MSGSSIRVFRALYDKNTWESIDGIPPEVDSEQLVSLLRSGNSALDHEPGFFFDTIEGYFVVSFEERKGHRGEKFFDLFHVPVNEAERTDLAKLVSWLDRQSMTTSDYQQWKTSGQVTRQLEYDPTRHRSGTGMPRDSSPEDTSKGSQDKTRPPAPPSSSDPADDDSDDEGGWSDEFKEVINSSDEESTDADDSTPSGHSSEDDVDAANHGSTFDERSVQDGRVTGDDPTARDDGTAGGRADGSEFIDETDSCDGTETVDGRTTRGDTGRDHREVDDPTVADDDAEILDDDGTDGRDEVTDEGTGGNVDDDAEILGDDDSPSPDGGTSQDLQLVAELYDRYRRGETGPSGAIPATLDELATFVRVVDGALGEISYVSNPRSSASAFDFAHGTRESTSAYPGIHRYLNWLDSQDALRWEKLPSYEDEIEYFIGLKKQTLSADVTYGEVFESAEDRMDEIVEEEVNNAKEQLRAVLMEDSSLPDRNLRQYVYRLASRVTGGPLSAQKNVDQVYRQIQAENLEDEQVDAVTTTIAARAALELDEKIHEKVYKQLEEELLEATNDDLVELTTETIRQGNEIANTESYRRYQETRPEPEPEDGRLVPQVAASVGVLLLVASIVQPHLGPFNVRNPQLGQIFVDDWLHLVTGLVGLLAGYYDEYARYYGLGVGSIYLLVALVGVLPLVGVSVLPQISWLSVGDHALHLVVGIVLLGVTTATWYLEKNSQD